MPNQTAETIARLLVEGVICRHGAPAELLSDRGANFMSELVAEVCALFAVKKVNTSGYHPQTNGLCERFNNTLIQMLAKTGEIWAGLGQTSSLCSLCISHHCTGIDKGVTVLFGVWTGSRIAYAGRPLVQMHCVHGRSR